MHTFSTCLKKLSNSKSKDISSQVDQLKVFVKDFMQPIRQIAPQYCLEFMFLIYNISKLKNPSLDKNILGLLTTLFLPWLKSASYPANFIMIKLIYFYKDLLDKEQWQFVSDIASELDHESFYDLQN